MIQVVARILPEHMKGAANQKTAGDHERQCNGNLRCNDGEGDAGEADRFSYERRVVAEFFSPVVFADHDRGKGA